MNVHATLVAARALIEDPAHWAQGSYARDELGNGVVNTLDLACCYCAEGAVCTALGVRATPKHIEDEGPALQSFAYLRASAILLMKRAGVSPRSGYHPDVDLNDGNVRLPGLTAHEATLAMFDDAITSALEARA
jgi:hypothetical protein